MANACFQLDDDGNFVLGDVNAVTLPGFKDAPLAEGADYLGAVAILRLTTERGTLRLHPKLGVNSQRMFVVDAEPVTQAEVVRSLADDPHIEAVNDFQFELDGRTRQGSVLVNISGDDGSLTTVQVGGA